MIKRILVKSLSSMLFLTALGANAGSYNISFDENGLRSPAYKANKDKVVNKGTIIDNEFSDDRAQWYVDRNKNELVKGVSVDFWVQSQWNGTDFDSANADLFLTLFNSNPNNNWNTQDPDLEVGQGNLAIINEHGDCDAGKWGGRGYCGDPDDRYDNGQPYEFNNDSFESGTPNGGFVFVHFGQPVNLLSIDLADMESGPNQQGSFAFYNSTGNMLGNTELMTHTGNKGYATHNFSIADSISYLVIRMQGSGGFKNLAFNTPPSKVTVPEPSTAVLFLIAMAFIYRQRVSA